MDGRCCRCGILLPSNRRECNALHHRPCSEGRVVTPASMPFWLPTCCSILLSFENVFSIFSFPLHLADQLSFVARPALLVPGIGKQVAWLQKKERRGFRGRSRSREEMRRGGPDSGELSRSLFRKSKSPAH